MIVESWIMQIKKIFTVFDVTEEHKVPFTTFTFVGEAEHWWTLKKDFLLTPTTQDPFLDAFYYNVFPIYIRGRKEENI